MSSWKRLSDNKDSFFYRIFFLEGYENSSNIYAIEGDYVTLIDTGNDWTAFFELFEIFDPEEVKKIVLTHGHSDHTLGLLELVQSYPDFNHFEVILHEAFAENLKNLLSKFNKEFKITSVAGGEKIDLSGYPFEVIHTPGHTIDSICLFHSHSSTIFSGDAVSVRPIIDDKLGGDTPSFVHSLRILKNKYAPRNILPGHTLPAFGLGDRILEKAYKNAIMTFSPENGDLKETAMNLIKVGLLDEAVIIINECLAEAENHEITNLLGLKASVLADMGKYQESLEIFSRICQDSPSALYSMGMIYMKLKDYQKAHECFEEYLKLRPDDKRAKIGMGMALYKLGRISEAMSIDEFRKIKNMV